LGHRHLSLPASIRQRQQARGPIAGRHEVRVHDQDSRSGRELAPKTLPCPPARFGGLILSQKTLLSKPNGRKDLIVPVDVTPWPVPLADQFEIKAHRLVGLGVVFCIDRQAGFLCESVQYVFGEFLVLSTVQHDAVLPWRTAREGEGERENGTEHGWPPSGE